MQQVFFFAFVFLGTVSLLGTFYRGDSDRQQAIAVQSVAVAILAAACLYAAMNWSKP